MQLVQDLVLIVVEIVIKTKQVKKCANPVNLMK